LGDHEHTHSRGTQFGIALLLFWSPRAIRGGWRSNLCPRLGQRRVLGPIFAAIWFFLWAWLLLGAPSFVRNLHRIFRRQEPSATDLRIAKVVGYMGIFFWQHCVDSRVDSNHRGTKDSLKAERSDARSMEASETARVRVRQGICGRYPEWQRIVLAWILRNENARFFNAIHYSTL